MPGMVIYRAGFFRPCAFLSDPQVGADAARLFALVRAAALRVGTAWPTNDVDSDAVAVMGCDRGDLAAPEIAVETALGGVFSVVVYSNDGVSGEVGCTLVGGLGWSLTLSAEGIGARAGEKSESVAGLRAGAVEESKDGHLLWPWLSADGAVTVLALPHSADDRRLVLLQQAETVAATGAAVAQGLARRWDIFTDNARSRDVIALTVRRCAAAAAAAAGSAFAAAADIPAHPWLEALLPLAPAAGFHADAATEAMVERAVGTARPSWLLAGDYFRVWLSAGADAGAVVPLSIAVTGNTAAAGATAAAAAAAAAAVGAAAAVEREHFFRVSAAAAAAESFINGGTGLSRAVDAESAAAAAAVAQSSKQNAEALAALSTSAIASAMSLDASVTSVVAFSSVLSCPDYRRRRSALALQLLGQERSALRAQAAALAARCERGIEQLSVLPCFCIGPAWKIGGKTEAGAPHALPYIFMAACGWGN
jgi:hypothetical protein